MREKPNQLCMELLSIARRTDLLDATAQISLDGEVGRAGRRRRRAASRHRREADEAERDTAGETCTSQSGMPGVLPYRAQDFILQRLRVYVRRAPCCNCI